MTEEWRRDLNQALMKAVQDGHRPTEVVVLKSHAMRLIGKDWNAPGLKINTAFGLLPVRILDDLLGPTWQVVFADKEIGPEGILSKAPVKERILTVLETEMTPGLAATLLESYRGEVVEQTRQRVLDDLSREGVITEPLLGRPPDFESKGRSMLLSMIMDSVSVGDFRRALVEIAAEARGER